MIEKVKSAAFQGCKSALENDFRSRLNQRVKFDR
jgi:transposase